MTEVNFIDHVALVATLRNETEQPLIGVGATYYAAAARSIGRRSLLPCSTNTKARAWPHCCYNISL